MGVKTASEIFLKTPEEEVKKNFDFSGDDLATGEVLSSVNSVTVDPPGELVATSPQITGNKVEVLITAGLDGKQYKVHCKVTTSLGQILEGCGRVKVGAC